MRQINGILAVITLFVMVAVSCKKDEPAVPAVPAYIGSWKESHFVATGCTDPADNEDHTCPAAECETITFTTTTITIVSPATASGDPASTETFNYTAVGNTLTATTPGGSITVEVTVVGTTLTFVLQNTPAQGGCKNTNTYTKI